MEKISSILSSSPRVKAVDIKEAHPIRPGVPTFGRPEGRSSLRDFKDKISVSQEAKDMAFKETLAAKNPQEARHAKIAADMTRNFFENRMKEPMIEESSDFDELPTPEFSANLKNSGSVFEKSDPPLQSQKDAQAGNSENATKYLKSTEAAPKGRALDKEI